MTLPSSSQKRSSSSWVSKIIATWRFELLPTGLLPTARPLPRAAGAAVAGGLRLVVAGRLVVDGLVVAGRLVVHGRLLSGYRVSAVRRLSLGAFEHIWRGMRIPSLIRPKSGPAPALDDLVAVDDLVPRGRVLHPHLLGDGLPIVGVRGLLGAGRRERGARGS